MRELKALGGLISLASWDQETYLPASADASRAVHLETLQAIHHERLVDPRLGDLLSEAAARADLPADQRTMVARLQRDRERAERVPVSLVRELAIAQSAGVTAWREARKRNDFRLFSPALADLLKLRRAQADALGHRGERYDALLEEYEPGMTVARLSPVLRALGQQLAPLVSEISARSPRGPSLFEGKCFAAEGQWSFTLGLLASMGFDLTAGRQDRSIHPFCSAQDRTDVRLTLRVDEAAPLSAIFSAIHEGGHGLYEQGFEAADALTPLAHAPSMGLHESQSRLWENLVGRSRPFWAHFLPKLQALFPAQLGGVGLEAFYAEVNRVEPSMIRTESDEVTYNLHIALRYELELAMIRGDLEVEGVPSAWNEAMKRLLGGAPPDDLTGVLQDIHWSGGDFGYFPTYALGNLYAASLFKAARSARPGLDQELARGELLPLREWLRAQVHRKGYRFTAEEIITQVTGRGLTDEDFIEYLKAKYATKG